MIEVNLKHHVLDFSVKFKDILIKYELYGKEDVDDLLDNLNIITSSLQENDDYFIPLVEHKIDQFGLAETAVKLANAGTNLEDISRTLSIISGVGVAIHEVEDWFKNYSAIKHTRTVKAYGNIFDVQERMQDIYESLIEHMKLIDDTPKEEFFRAKTTREQVKLEVLRDVRAITKDAKEILKTINHYQRLEEFKSLVIQTIKTIDPTVATMIVEKLAQDKALFNALLPPS
jgi:hypothetical protein